MKKYILLYSNKKNEDNICLTNMFKNNRQINIGWNDFDIKSDMKVIDELVNEGYEELIFGGFETGWDILISNVKDKYHDLIVKVICNTQDSLLYYDYERDNFFKLLELTKNKIVDEIAFLRKSQYELYKELGYSCCYLLENYVLDKKIDIEKHSDDKIYLGVYPLSYTWDKNIFNQLCVGKMLDNSIIRYNCLDERMKDFLDTMHIDSIPVKLSDINDQVIINEVIKNDVVIATSFTEYLHPLFLIAMELGIPCLIGNNSDFFDDCLELKEYVVTSAEDNAIINSEMINKLLSNRNKVINLYHKWKKEYNQRAEESIKQFIG